MAEIGGGLLRLVCGCVREGAGEMEVLLWWRIRGIEKKSAVKDKGQQLWGLKASWIDTFDSSLRPPSTILHNQIKTRENRDKDKIK